ncbi:MAG: sugar transferase, partial [Deltaproteobacteria bacterium]|nr:sugar transferase [Deltaproteobacteria bacterium]
MKCSSTTAEDLRNRSHDGNRLARDIVGTSTAVRLWKRRGSLLFCLDLVAGCASFLIAYYVRFHGGPLITGCLPTFEPAPDVTPYLKAAGLTTAVWILLLARERTYRNDLHFTTGLFFQIRQVVVTGFYALIFLMVISFLYRHLLLSRVVYVSGFVLSCTVMILVRMCFREIDRVLQGQRVTVYRVLLLGWNSNGATLIRRLQSHNRCTEVVGRLTWSGEESDLAPGAANIPVLGGESDLELVFSHSPFDQLLVLSSGENGHDCSPDKRDVLMSTLNFCEERDIPFYVVPDFLDVAVTRQELGSFSGIPLFRLRDAALHPGYAVIKRTMDIAVSAFVLVVGMPLWIFIGALIKATSRGSVIYKQERVGLHGRPFSMYKFRSMVADAEERLPALVNFERLEEPVFKLHSDPR